MIRVLIADDHPIVRTGLQETIDGESDMRVVAQARDGEETLELFSKGAFDILILDISMPKVSGLEVLEKLRGKGEKCPILILSMYSEDQYATRALKMGASGFLPKESPPEMLIAAIRKLASGGRFVTAALAEKLVMQLENDGRAPHERLSNREFLIMKMIAGGKTPKEIAEYFSISVKTVSTYRSRIMGKMEFRRNAELVRYCLEHHLLEGEA